MKTSTRTAGVIVALGAVAHGAILPRAAINPLAGLGLSDACQNTVSGLLSNNDISKCFNVPGLAAIFTLFPNNSAVPAVDTWLRGVCQADPCSDSTLQAIGQNVTTGCQSDITKTGVSSTVLGTIVADIPKYYPTVREMACLKSTSNDTLCATSSLLDLQNFVGEPLSIKNVLSLVPQFIQGDKSLPASLTCTQCAQAAIGVFAKDQPDIANSMVVSGTIAGQCGPDFTQNPTPSGVTEGLGSDAPTSTPSALQAASKANGASHLSTHNIALVGMSALALFVAL